MNGSVHLDFNGFGKKIISEAEQVLAFMELSGIANLSHPRVILQEFLKKENSSIVTERPCPECDVEKVKTKCGGLVWPCLIDKGCKYVSKIRQS